MFSLLQYIPYTLTCSQAVSVLSVMTHVCIRMYAYVHAQQVPGSYEYH